MKRKIFSSSILYLFVFAMFSFTMIFLFTLYMRLPAYMLFFKHFRVKTPLITNMYLSLAQQVYNWGFIINTCVFLGSALCIIIILFFRKKDLLFKAYAFGVSVCIALVAFAESALTLPVILTMNRVGAAITPFSIGLAKSAIERQEAERFFVPAYLKEKLKNIEEREGFISRDVRALRLPYPSMARRSS